MTCPLDLAIKWLDGTENSKKKKKKKKEEEEKRSNQIDVGFVEVVIGSILGPKKRELLDKKVEIVSKDY
jgi:hypothetical protein